MAWITIAESDVLNRLSDGEKTAFELASGNSTPSRLAGILSQVTALVRGKVASCKDNRGNMGDTGTIPDELLWAACTIARHSLISNLPTFDEQPDARNRELDQAYKQLDDVASCEFGIASPDGSGDIVQSVGVYGGSDLLEF